jgi:gephyrin
MSRPTAGVRNKSVIVTLPGSPKGAKENLEAIIKTLPHACLQAAGANSRALHSGGVKKLEQDAGITGGPDTSHTHKHHHHHHHHHHGHGGLVRHTKSGTNPLSNDPLLGPTRRHRESPYPMVSVDDALSRISDNSPDPEVVTVMVDESIVGSVLAEDVEARENVPAFRASIVDGYAVVVPKDGVLRGTFPVTAVSHAAPGEIGELKEGEIARITTGAPLPPGATTVIMVEDTVLRTMTDDGKEEKEVEIQVEGVKEGENIREVGSDIKQGTVILNKGEQISGVGGEIGLLAAVGVAEVSVYRRPVIGILSTGDEIVEYHRPGDLKLGEVRDTNRITLISAAKQWGFDVVDLGIAKDKSGSLEETLRDGLRRADMLITTGGVSMGELDLLKPTIERSLGGTIHFGRVAMKPGKPTTFATVPVKDNDGQRVSKVIFSLPGNPASALVTFHLFVLPSLHKQSGISPVGLPKVSVVLAHDFPLDPRPEYHRAVVTVGNDGVLSASSTGGQRSSKVGSLRSANALVCMPSGKGKLEKGSRVYALIMDAVRPS